MTLLPSFSTPLGNDLWETAAYLNIKNIVKFNIVSFDCNCIGKETIYFAIIQKNIVITKCLLQKYKLELTERRIK